MTKTAILNVPRLEPHRPPPGPAIIANICIKQGHQVIAYDLNIKFFHYCKIFNVDYYEFDLFWDKVIPLTGDKREFVNKFIEYYCEELAQGNFDFIMVGIFGHSGHIFSEMFLKHLRTKVSSKIVIGGMGVGSSSLLNNNEYFGYKMRELGYVDYFVVGEGEDTIIKILNNQSGPGINNSDSSQIDDLDELPIPDYSIYNLDEYDYLIPGNKEVFITGSRGCVRKCTYCDVERYWPKYRYRSGESIAREIIHNYETLGVTKFYFTDSLVNGSIKAFDDMCNKLANYKFDEKISWSGQFIFREKRSIPKDHYQMIAESGADILFVGIETGSDKIRYEMGKKFTNEDIDYQLAECSKYGVKVNFLMLTGYITETLDDHKDTLDIFKRWQKYVADGTIMGVDLGHPLAILTGTPLERMIDSHGIVFMADDNQEPLPVLWQSTINPELTVRERIKRTTEVHLEAVKHCWPVWRQQNRLFELKNLIIEHKLYDDVKPFYKITTQENNKAKKIIAI
jgi:hypothetical protein